MQLNKRLFLKQLLYFFVVVYFFYPDLNKAQGVFFYEYWAEFDSAVSNHKDGRWRVNDPELSLHETFGKRSEARANGLMLIKAPVDLFEIESAELYLELWGGHPGTAEKRVIVNGKKAYAIPDYGTERHHCTYSYPSIPITVSHLVNGINAFQFACERDETFWGHYIIDNASLHYILKSDHPDLIKNGLNEFKAEVVRLSDGLHIQDQERIGITIADGMRDKIRSVIYFGNYFGFDDTGNLKEMDWHGFTQKRQYQNVIGISHDSPFEVVWDTRMIPTQPKPMTVKALVKLTNGIQYWTPVLHGLTFAPDRPQVKLYHCVEMPIPYWSRANQQKLARMLINENLEKIDSAELWVKIWDGGQGRVTEPFILNGHPYHIISGNAIHDVVFTRTEIDLSHLKQGVNEFSLSSDTDHHGIEMLLPGPCIILRWKSQNYQ